MNDHELQRLNLFSFAFCSLKLNLHQFDLRNRKGKSQAELLLVCRLFHFLIWFKFKKKNVLYSLFKRNNKSWWTCRVEHQKWLQLSILKVNLKKESNRRNRTLKTRLTTTTVERQSPQLQKSSESVCKRQSKNQNQIKENKFMFFC